MTRADLVLIAYDRFGPEHVQYDEANDFIGVCLDDKPSGSTWWGFEPLKVDAQANDLITYYKISIAIRCEKGWEVIYPRRRLFAYFNTWQEAVCDGALGAIEQRITKKGCCTVMSTGTDARGEHCSTNREHAELGEASSSPGEITIQRAWRNELDPTQKQIRRLQRCCDLSRWVWNWALADRIAKYEAKKVALAEDDSADVSAYKTNAYQQSRDLTSLLLQPELAWAKQGAGVPRTVSTFALRDLDMAYKHFFRRVKSGNTPGFPRFKSWRDSVQSCSFQGAHCTSTTVTIPRIGTVRLKQKYYFPRQQHINRLTVIRHANRWFVAAQADDELPTNDLVAGTRTAELFFDLPGAIRIISCGIETVIQGPHPLASELKRLKRLGRRVSRRFFDKESGKESNRRKDSRLRLQRFHAHVSWRRREYIHQTTSHLVKEYGRFVIHELPIKEIIEDEKTDSLAMADAGWGEFLRLLKYKTHWSGGTYEEAGRDTRYFTA